MLRFTTPSLWKGSLSARAPRAKPCWVRSARQGPPRYGGPRAQWLDTTGTVQVTNREYASGGTVNYVPVPPDLIIHEFTVDEEGQARRHAEGQQVDEQQPAQAPVHRRRPGALAGQPPHQRHEGQQQQAGGNAGNLQRLMDGDHWTDKQVQAICKEIVADLESQGLLVEVKKHKLMVPRCARTGQVIEPMLTDQWFVAMNKVSPQNATGKSIAQKAIDAVQSGDVKIVINGDDGKISDSKSEIL